MYAKYSFRDIMRSFYMFINLIWTKLQNPCAISERFTLINIYFVILCHKSY